MITAKQRPSFQTLVQTKFNEKKLLCVGLDPDPERLARIDHPQLSQIKSLDLEQARSARQQIFDHFLRPIIEVTAQHAAAFKLNYAFYERDEEGKKTFSKTVDFILKNFPDIPIIGDAKRGDTSNTTTGYAEMAYIRDRCDGVTVSQYLGPDTLGPFLKYPGKATFSLAKTSNPDAGVYQDAPVNLDRYQANQRRDPNGRPLSEEEMELAQSVADEGYIPFYQLVVLQTNRLAKLHPDHTVGFVVGATQKEALIATRRLAPNSLFLIPGLGAQGGDLKMVLKYAPNKEGTGILVSASRTIDYASLGKDYIQAAGRAARNYTEQINRLRQAA